VYFVHTTVTRSCRCAFFVRRFNNRICITNVKNDIIPFFHIRQLEFVKIDSIYCSLYLHLRPELAVLKACQEQFHNSILSQNTKGSNSNKNNNFYKLFSYFLFKLICFSEFYSYFEC
jgi:hypothetical protein